MKYKVTIERTYTVASFTFDNMTDAASFAQVAAKHINNDDDGREFTVHIELIKEVENETV